MADMFQTSISGLLAYQRALATTGHNISNVNTPGYSRQSTQYATRIPQAWGGNWIGSGVDVVGVKRIVDDARVAAVRSNSTEFKRLDTIAELSGRIDNLLADKNAGLSPALQGVFSAASELANDPASQTSRQVLLSEAENLISRFQFLEGRLDEIERDIDHRMRMQVQEINHYAEAIAKLNQELALVRGQAGGRDPNDLLDKREQLLLELSERVATQVVMQDDGAMNVSIGNGQGLVVGNNANKLAVIPNAYDPSRSEIAFVSGSSSVNVSRNLKGGTLGGILEYRQNMLDPARNELGTLAASLAMEFNNQHKLGVRFDVQDGRMGGDFFSLPDPLVRANLGRNTPGLDMPTVEFDPTKVGALTGSDYRLTFKSDNWVLTRQSDGRVLDADADGVFRVDGLVIDPSGIFDPDDTDGPQAKENDSFLIQPTAATVGRLSLAISRPEQIAASAPIISGEATDRDLNGGEGIGQGANSGSGRIGPVTVSAAPEATFGDPILLTYDPDRDGFVATQGGDEIGVVAFDPALHSGGRTATLEHDGWSMSFQLSGWPDDGDAFVLSGNRDGRGDNGNMLQLAKLQDKDTMAGGNVTFQEFYSSLVGNVGANTMRANINRDAQNTLLNQAVAARDAVSGVNLDEEAANLLKLQQAYQASAQGITIANSMFQALLDAVRR